jgi:hypothetical protein
MLINKAISFDRTLSFIDQELITALEFSKNDTIYLL